MNKQLGKTVKNKKIQLNQRRRDDTTHTHTLTESHTPLYT